MAPSLLIDIFWYCLLKITRGQESGEEICGESGFIHSVHEFLFRATVGTMAPGYHGSSRQETTWSSVSRIRLTSNDETRLSTSERIARRL
jgi:hypothetical protein